MGTNRVCGGAKPSERSEEHDLIEILIRVLLDEMETVFPIIADQFISTVQTDRSASNDGIGLPDPRQSLVHEELVDAGILGDPVSREQGRDTIFSQIVQWMGQIEDHIRF